MIARLGLIADELSNAQSLESAIQGLALHGCLSGQNSRIFLGSFSDNLQLHHEVSFGFESESSYIEKYGNFLSSRYLSQAITKPDISILDHRETYRSNYEKFIGVKENSEWQSTILMPLVPNFIVGLSTHAQYRRTKRTIDYFNALRAIFNIFIRSKGFHPTSDRGPRSSNKGSIQNSQLTERQNLILKMIESGDTNQVIAERMGYSESLIRQETIIIYRKLGISGRRDLDIRPR